jgi:LytS/YehU family sensor histidine kinase
MLVLLAENNFTLVSQVAMFLLLPLVAVFSFVIFIVYRHNRESQLRREQAELELKALRAQMNPHFMFNCLSSIYHTMQQNRVQEAGEYLLKFSFLLRRVLENSGKKWISLQEELDMLKSYLDLEQMRTNHRFTYTLHVAEDLECEQLATPMLIAQPFLENSIWHGFAGKSGTGEIRIAITGKDNQLIYSIEDNGTLTNREEPAQDMGKRQSMGTSLISEQLAAIRLLEKANAGFDTEDLVNDAGEYKGRRVVLFLPLITLY